ncbi:unnamed protein product [Allacma fusca]|uniref:U3 small nucleolar ribonucleoprotein protein MPP10 n=1 Tax=Allacma fusca TaxID=39272 RepID=A0A8J2MA44_9HEXA|nr:unnamed protein product [Allacma fusca]
MVVSLMELEELHNGVKAFQPEDFVGNRKEVASKCLEILKVLYDYTKKEEKNAPSLTIVAKPEVGKKKKVRKEQLLSRTEAPLESLITEGFDNEQIWQEIQLQNNLMYENLVTSVSKLLAHQRYVTKNDSQESEEERDQGDQDMEEGDVLGEPGDSSGEEYEEGEKLLEAGGLEEEEEDSMEEEDGSHLGNGNTLGGGGDEERLGADKDEPVTPEQLSNFEKRKKRIEENIELIEEEALQPKAWQFQGEVTAQSRPENSLLEEHLIFDHLLRQAPEVTAETTLRLEDIIKQRIKDQAWDDVDRKVKPIDDPFAFKKKLVLDAEKSKMSLSQIYEKEYIDKQKVEEGEEQREEIPPEQLEIQKSLESLFAKLDALSNFHYTPKALSAEIKVVSNLPTVSVEEVAPVSVSDATLLAPQEIQSQSKGEIKGKAERTDTDRKRERRQKKKTQKLKRISREEKAKLKGLGLRNIKLADNISKSNKRAKLGDGNESFENSKELKSSKAFFNKLQNQVDSHIKKVVVKKKKSDVTKLSPKKLKL